MKITYFVYAMTVMFAATNAAQAQSKYTVQDLGFTATAINANGNVVGYFQTAGGAPYNHAALYDGSMHDLGTLNGYWAVATDISDAGLIVGYGNQPASSGTYQAFSYDGSMHNLITGYSEAKGVNSSGTIVGWAGDGQRAFLYDGVLHDLGSLGGSASMALSINDAGLAVGWSQTAGNAAQHAFLYNGSMHDLGTIGGGNSIAAAINNQGVIVGQSDGHAFMYDGIFHDLGMAGSFSYANAINSDNKIVGNTLTPGNGQHAFLYDGTSMLDLNELLLTGLPRAGNLYLADAVGINDLGQIVANDGLGHGYLLTPVASVPLPAGGWLFASGLSWLFFSRKRSL